MIIRKKNTVESLPLSMDVALTLYPDFIQNQGDREKLACIIRVLMDSPEAFRGSYTCYIENGALKKFLEHANNIYKQKGYEATGLFVGYYLHSMDDPEKKVAVATDFLPAFGNTAVTCEISHQDAIRNAEYCESHKVLPLVWPHTHPFNRPLRYSSVDSATLACDFSSPHQMGFVYDNLCEAYMGFKIINGMEFHESFYSFDLIDSLNKGVFSSKSLYVKPVALND